MKKIMERIKQYKLVMIVALIIIIIGTTLLFVLVDKKITMKSFENDYYNLSYDNAWKLKDKTALTVFFDNGNKASLNIELVNVDDEYKYLDIDDIIDDLLYTIGSQNKDYKLISQKEDKITKTEYNGYKLLYENGSSETMITIFKSGDKVVIFDYEAQNKYFDILLDSVQNIIYNFNLKPDTFNLTENISVNTEEINYANNAELDVNLDNTKDYEVANNNYYVNYSLPSIFKLNSFNSKLGLLEYSSDYGKIDITSAVYNVNMYDYFDSSKTYGTIYTEYSYLRDDSETYRNLEEKISDFKIGEYSGYIYKASYTYHFIRDREDEKYIIVVALNKNHMFKIEITSEGIKVSKKLIEKIKINSVKNYSSYVVRDIQDGNLNIELKRFRDSKYKEYDLVKVKIPEKYREIDNEFNIYEERYFGLNYDTDNQVYQYNINYKLTSKYSSVNSQMDLANSNMNYYSKYGEIKKMIEQDSVNINGKEFQVFNGSYYKNDKLYNSSEDNVIYKVNRKILMYELENGGYLTITIDGNNTNIDDNILNELSNFEVTKEVYN